MNKYNHKIGLAISVVLLITLCFFSACKKAIDLEPVRPADPETNNRHGLVFITSVSAHTGVYGATVVINGIGFSSTIANNQVYFNNKAAVISAATPTR